MVAVVAVVVLMLGTGCTSTNGGLSWNMRQSLLRGGGDIAATVALDEGVNKAELQQFTEAVVKLIEQGTLTKGIFEAKVKEIAGTKYVDYVDRLFAVIPSELGVADLIPADVKAYLLSFLKYGGLYGMSLYDDSRKPTK
jgi:hypothetical protein